MTLTSLIEAVEKASGPDRELDALIDCAIRFPQYRPARPDDHVEFQRGIPPSRGSIYCPTGFLLAERYTSSLDAALTLVPEGAEISITNLYCIAHAEVGLNFHEGPCYGEHKGSSLCLALCAAALKARVRQSSEQK